MPSEPYFIGSHSGASGAWTSGPEDLQTAESKNEYFWGYNRMTTVKGLFAAGVDTGGWSGKTYNPHLSGIALGFTINSGRIAGENAAKYISGKR